MILLLKDQKTNVCSFFILILMPFQTRRKLRARRCCDSLFLKLQLCIPGGAALNDSFDIDLSLLFSKNCLEKIYRWFERSLIMKILWRCFDIRRIEHKLDSYFTSQLLVQSLCPAIYGHEIVKMALLLALFGGTNRSRNSIDKIESF